MHSMVYGLDINPGVPMFPREPNIKTLVGDSSRMQEVEPFDGEEGCLNFIVDDGYHSFTNQRLSMARFFPYLCKRGLAYYVIEDIERLKMVLIEHLLSKKLRLQFARFDDKSGEHLVVIAVKDGTNIQLPRALGGHRVDPPPPASTVKQ